MRLVVTPPPITCPSCGAKLAWHAALFPKFYCPNCRNELRVRRVYFAVANAFALIILVLGGYAIGLRGDALLAVVFLGAVPAIIAVQLISMWLFPPDLEITGDFHGILYGIDSHESDSALRSQPDENASSSPDTIDAARRSMFRGIVEPRTMEGLGIKAGGLVMVVWAVWMLFRPAFIELVPLLSDTRTGPPGFPMTVDVGDLSVGFTNGSRSLWQCNAELGRSLQYAYAFSIAPQQTVDVSYESFRGTSQADGDTLKRAARTRVSMSCADPSGIRHYWDFR